MAHLYEDKKTGIIHACETGKMHPSIILVWTLCGKDVPANASYETSAEFPSIANCKDCHKAGKGQS